MKEVFICPRRHRLGEAEKANRNLLRPHSPLNTTILGGRKRPASPSARACFRPRKRVRIAPSEQPQARAECSFLFPPRAALALALVDRNEPRRCRRGLILLRPYGLVGNLILKCSVFLFSFLPPFPLPSFSLSEPLTKTRKDGGEYAIRGNSNMKGVRK